MHSNYSQVLSEKIEAYIKGAKEQDKIVREELLEKVWNFFIDKLSDEHNKVFIKTDDVDEDGEDIEWCSVYEDDFYNMLKKVICS